jgi:hypothetical protein
MPDAGASRKRQIETRRGHSVAPDQWIRRSRQFILFGAHLPRYFAPIRSPLPAASRVERNPLGFPVVRKSFTQKIRHLQLSVARSRAIGTRCDDTNRAGAVVSQYDRWPDRPHVPPRTPHAALRNRQLSSSLICCRRLRGNRLSQSLDSTPSVAWETKPAGGCLRPQLMRETKP